MKAVTLKRTGGPEVLEYVELPMPVAGAQDVLVKAHTIGVSMPEVLVRTGTYAWMPPLPAILGIEMSGTVIAAGAAAKGVKVGDAVFVSARELPVRAGCYAEYIAVPAETVEVLPDGVDLEAAACLSNYQVAWHLLHSATRGMQYDSVLASAAAGGVGSAIIELARLDGKTVIGLAGSEEKCRFVERLGARAINYRAGNVAARVRELTASRGVDLVLDSVGGPDFMRNFDFVGTLGLVVSYGQIAGPAAGDVLKVLRGHRATSPGLRCFTMHAYDKLPEKRRAATRALLDLLAAGRIRPVIHDRLPLAEARRAHELFDSGAVMGKMVLKP